VGGSYEALKAGRLAEATAGFESIAQARASEFSVQLLVACSAQTIEKAIQNDPSTELYVLPATIGGKACHRLMRGYYKTLAEATQAVASLPGYYVAEGAKPKAVPVKSIVR
jgi:septal ring-binding cell division protein DamX